MTQKELNRVVGTFKRHLERLTFEASISPKEDYLDLESRLCLWVRNKLADAYFDG